MNKFPDWVRWTTIVITLLLIVGVGIGIHRQLRRPAPAQFSPEFQSHPDFGRLGRRHRT